MPDDNGGPIRPRSLGYLQENLRRAGPAIAASYTLIGAIVLCGGIGYLADRWLGTAPSLVIAGLLLGVIVGLYELAKTVWRR
jgi:F0F1-type ATP synthase assembly protein I